MATVDKRTARVVDTSAWIELLAGSPVGARVKRAVPEPAQWLVPTIVQLELAKWLSRERSKDDLDRTLAFTDTCQVVPLDTRVALRAAELHREYKLATADAVIYATALDNGADLLTCDKHFDGLPSVVYLAKVADTTP